MVSDDVICRLSETMESVIKWVTYDYWWQLTVYTIKTEQWGPILSSSNLSLFLFCVLEPLVYVIDVYIRHIYAGVFVIIVKTDVEVDMTI